MILTIGIPTYNRGLKLKSILESLQNQILLFNNSFNIEVLVSNNASTDLTPQILLEKSEIFNFKYFNQTENIGFDRNVDFLFKNAKGDFLWILSDDDIITNDSVSQVYTALFNHQHVKFAFINYNINCDGNLLYSNINNKVDLNVVNSVELMTNINFANSLVSSCVFNVKLWNSIKTYLYFGSCWIHMYVARDILISGKSLILNNPLIEMQQIGIIESRKEQKKVKGIEYYFYAHINLVKYCSTLFNSGYPKQVQQQANKYCSDGDLGHLFNFKLYNKSYSIFEISKIIKELFPYRKSSFTFYFTFVPLMLLPGLIFKLLYFLKNRKFV